MPKGGARARSGPPPDETSGRSEQRGFSLTALPTEGHRGRAPAFPLPATKRSGPDGVNQAATKAFRAREIAIWREVWKTPQAAAWAQPGEAWRWPTVAEFCRIKAAVELDPDSNAALLSRLREYRNEIGLSPDGLRANGWKISTDDLAAKKAAKKATAPAKKAAPARRLRSVGGGTA
ncbi:hypothetical protein [Nocardioides campestrisoli]|uniref:hypothetical protein n=1 Tax=Nocardioides campestrisoli TaxID=2736757 RepID=UPI0015E6BDFB|nr:hypothetical protein [Nocardioides campestrisoli]